MKPTLLKDEQLLTERVEDILIALNSHKLRATYNVVGEVLGIPEQSVGYLLGQIRPYASWVVARGTKSPRDYSPDEYHPELFVHSEVIDSVPELDRLLSHDEGQ